MTEYIFPPAAPASVAVADSSARFPVRRIFCVGRNYAAHVREMGSDPERAAPIFFSKAADTVVDDGAYIPYPTLTSNLHHEGELVVAIGVGGRSIEIADSLNHVWGYAVGNDLTRRDIQQVARETGSPWDMSKSFDNSAICGPVHPADTTSTFTKGSIQVHVNGEIRQDADLEELIWSLPEIISILSRAVELKPGDLIYTGTPAGVGPLERGDVCTVSIEGLGTVTTTISG